MGVSCCGQILGTISTDYSIQFHDISEIDQPQLIENIEEEEDIEKELSEQQQKKKSHKSLSLEE